MGMIGGPDGPTAVFVSGSPGALLVLLAVLVVLAAAVFALFRRNK